MRIVCPACSATYEVPEDRVPPGRAVRCARCASDWTPVPETEPPEAPAIDPDLAAELEAQFDVEHDPATDAEPAPADEEAEPEFEPESLPPIADAADRLAVSSGPAHPRALRAAWALTGVVLLAAIWLGYSARDSVMHAWPPSVRAYAALGLVARH